MLRFLADENIEFPLVAALRRDPDIDIVTARDVGLVQTADPIILEWAAQEARVVLTHDVSTLANDAYERIAAGLPMPGVIVLPQRFNIGRAAEEIRQLEYASPAGNLQGMVVRIRGR